MPVDWSKYPADWPAIALAVKTEAEWKCAVCGHQCRQPGDVAGRVLTVAHLNHNEAECERSNLMAMCSVCHLRYDARTKAQRRMGAEKTPDIRGDLETVYHLTYKDRRIAFMREHDRWPRGSENDVIAVGIPIFLYLWPEDYAELDRAATQNRKGDL